MRRKQSKLNLNKSKKENTSDVRLVVVTTQAVQAQATTRPRHLLRLRISLTSWT